MAYHGPIGLALRPGLVRRPQARGIRGVTLGFNPNPPSPPSLLRRNFFWKHSSVPHLIASSTSGRLTGVARQRRSPPLHSTTDPTPFPMALKACEEDPKPPVNDPSGSVLRGGRSDEGFGPRWGSGVVAAHRRR
jgi:hypothetical protein